MANILNLFRNVTLIFEINATFFIKKMANSSVLLILVTTVSIVKNKVTYIFFFSVYDFG